jgi:hypothetical protein
MEKYYFIQQNGVKKGAFKLNELKEENIYFDELVWRSDEDKWKKASEFEELAGIYLIKPPLTPLEIAKNDINKEFLNKVLPNTLGIYFILFLIISISSFLIANSSWEEEKKAYITNKDEAGKPSYSVREKKIDDLEKELKDKIVEIDDLEKKISSANKNNLDWQEIDGLKFTLSRNQRDTSYIKTCINIYNQELIYGNNSNQSVIQPTYNIPENIVALENINGLQQPFLFRPFYAYFSKIYLIREEQDSAGKLFVNIALSTFSLLLMLLIINLIIIYSIKISKANPSQ